MPKATFMIKADSKETIYIYLSSSNFLFLACLNEARLAFTTAKASLSGTWSSGYRARRIRQMLEGKEGLTRHDFLRLQLDVLSMRAVAAVPGEAP